ncbi:MAG TPA: efflux RND transporter periplasmic adaptor subunit [Acidobacteriota bacterium]|nr:efflux RND transporter periplasmic adaptor subunit [Acidobacteriota bacterium]HNR37525.1 efflux RND transporter periplasmic adaptor subunit [Acidobacteriota bacterium]HNT99718.1 efflux RND transporter periplasmic adaptor subunit [Acidobacteriota bacterium]HPB27945.1 efflux RND transporter periplasmic adaptor subunit [Acidobacteriota bacterium]HQO25500.1 efflux RND transporter periplasmic adaptor subunit [Acidobacteriota bacterium]
MICRITLCVCTAALLLVAAGCSNLEADRPPTAGRPPVAVDVVTLTAESLEEGIDVVGTLAPKFQTEVKSEYTGIVTDVYVTEWVRVRQGQPLARLDTREGDVMLRKAQAAVEASQANVLQAEVALSRADRELARLTNIKQYGLVTQQTVDDARSARDAAEAQVAAAKAQQRLAEDDVRHTQTRLDKAVIRAPMNGTVALRGVNVGDLAGEMGSPKVMFQIVDNRFLELTVTVPEARLSELRLGQPLTFTTDAVPDRTFTGEVKHINPAVSVADRSVRVIAEVRNEPEVLKGGLFAKGRIVTGRREDVRQLPREALQGWDVAAGRADVFVVENDTARRRSVQTGAVAGDNVEILAGLAVGNRVVVRGAFNLKDGDRIQVGR